MAEQSQTELLFHASPGILHGISDKREKLFEQMGIRNLYDLVCHFPRLYENRGNLSAVQALSHGQTASVIVRIESTPVYRVLKRNMNITKCVAADDSGRLQLIFFNQPYRRQTLVPGSVWRCYGKVQAEHFEIQMINPKTEAVAPGTTGESLPALLPVYPAREGLTQKIISDAVQSALTMLYPANTPDSLPLRVREQYNLCGEKYAMQQVHRPQSAADLERARRRIIFEELTVFALGLSQKRALQSAQTALPCPRDDVAPFLRALPYALTGAQSRAVADLQQDMCRKSSPMHRLLMGDVGSGKTVCAAAAIYLAVQNGYQAAMMAPTEILARQHQKSLEKLFAPLGIPVTLLIGATKPREKERIKRELSDGAIPVVIGTHALLQDDVAFGNLGLVITDEQHRFGVMQRARLQNKTQGVHVLVMSATPIPRTLALMLFGDLEQTTLDELPPGRQTVQTVCVDSSYRARLNTFLAKQVQAGRQAYIVCPAISRTEEDARLAEQAEYYSGFSPVENEESDARKCAVEYAQELQQVFPAFRIGCLHGKMKSDEKDAVMSEFAAGNMDILVCTTVVEVGVDVPNATLIVIENAELFGLSQLHQLRGRVGRGTEKSYCVLISDAQSEAAKQRLQTMRQTASGFEVAKKDLELRGPGDFFSRGGLLDREFRQSGGIRFRMADLCEDMATVSDAFAAAAEILREDPTLSEPGNQRLRQKMLLQ